MLDFLAPSPSTAVTGFSMERTHTFLVDLPDMSEGGGNSPFQG
jgi:hypothetical protein